MEFYYDNFTQCFVLEKESTAAPERYVKYVSDEGTRNLWEKHYIGSIKDSSGSVDKYITMHYTAEDVADPVSLDKSRIQFFVDNGILDYNENAAKYRTTEMCIQESHFNDILEKLKPVEILK